MSAYHGPGQSYHGAGQSSVGHRAFYEDGDQRNEPQSAINERDRYKEGQAHSHQNLDSKDQRSIANKLASQERKPNSAHHHNNVYDEEAELSKQDPTKPVSPNQSNGIVSGRSGF